MTTTPSTLQKSTVLRRSRPVDHKRTPHTRIQAGTVAKTVDRLSYRTAHAGYDQLRI